MRITVIGVGNAGSTVAAQLSHNGHSVTLLKTSNKLHNEHYSELLRSKTLKVKDYYLGDYETNIYCVTDSFELAIPNADVIIVYVQAN